MSRAERILVIDCQLAGISGDMLLGALLDLGANVQKVVKAVELVKNHLKGCRSLDIAVNDVIRGGFRAKRVEVKAEEEVAFRTGIELREAILNCIREQNLSEEAKKLALNSIDVLINAEAKVHGESVTETCLYEVGSVDTVVDIVGTAITLDDLGLLKDTKVYSTPLAVGGGLFRFSHGTVPSPAPATIEILKSKNFPMIGGPVDAELATPTGVGLLVNMVDATVSFYPSMKPLAVGYGAGARDFVEIPNILRITLGEPLSYDLLFDEIEVLETNLDDVSGEVIGHVIDRLLEEGAKDVSVIPMFTKKNRPGQILKIITDREKVNHLSQVLMRETGTLGLRIYPCRRYILAREFIPLDISIEGVTECVNVKIAKNSRGEIFQIKPEYDDIKRLVDKTGKPLREIEELVKIKARKVLSGR
ncbi:nickel pincer cofactor biosynthesis protein LarC [Candidatus Bathyarchaeota archaeon]|nr:nickel pincer cofactor biosynthesis protein LarC [Candidatus Bathyarchaeota archaeon]